ncbi:MAG: Hsp20 family protein [Blastocatellia bacterium]|nr:Hsp20 family protein [Blastocatellia bacterium]
MRQEAQKQALEKPESSLFVKAEHLLEQMEQIYKDISKRAYELFTERGMKHGFDRDDWFKAESEMLKAVPVEMTEVEGNLKARFDVPSFKPEELKVSVEADRLIVSGKSEVREEKKEAEKVVYSELKSNQFMRQMLLPKEVIAEKAVATLKDGVLEVVIPILQKEEVKEQEKNVEVKPI